MRRYSCSCVRKAEGGSRKAEGGGRRAEVGGRRAEGGSRRPEVGSRKSDGANAEVNADAEGNANAEGPIRVQENRRYYNRDGEAIRELTKDAVFAAGLPL